MRKAIFFLGAAAAIFAASRFLVFNLTESLPPGLYLRTNAEPHRGDIVLVAPPDREIFREARARGFMTAGLCPSGTGRLIKIMASGPDDTVDIADSGMQVNGSPLPNSSRKDVHLKNVVPLPVHGTFPDKVLLYTPHPFSFDSRYFGLLPRTCIISVLRPLLTR